MHVNMWDAQSRHHIAEIGSVSTPIKPKLVAEHPFPQDCANTACMTTNASSPSVPYHRICSSRMQLHWGRTAGRQPHTSARPQFANDLSCFTKHKCSYSTFLWQIALLHLYTTDHHSVRRLLHVTMQASIPCKHRRLAGCQQKSLLRHLQVMKQAWITLTQ